MAESVKNYQLSKIANNKSFKRIINEIKKIPDVNSASIDKENNILRIEIDFNNDDKNYETKLITIEEEILKKIHIYEKKAVIEQVVSKEVYRKVLYLNGLDCAHCATKVETIAKKTLDYDKLLVDFTSYRFIIETSNKELADNILEEVSKIAHRVDDKIVVTDKATKKEDKILEPKKGKSIVRMILAIIGIISFIVAQLAIIKFDFSKWRVIFEHNEVFINGDIYQKTHIILLLITYFFIGYPVIWSFFKNLIKGRIFNENCLMTIASLGAIGTGHYVEASIVLALFQIGEYLQERAVNHCRKSINELLSIDVKNAKLKKDNEIIEISVDSILPDDIIIVNKGELIPLDGVLLSDKAVLDTKNITGESLLRHVKKTEEIMAGSVNMGKVIEIKVIRPHSESMVQRITDMVENASTLKAKSENFISKFSRYYTPLILIIAVIIVSAGAIYEYNFYNYTHTIGQILNEWIYRGMLFLVISCPCALVISIPLCFFAGIGVSSKNGILIKGSNYLETLNNVDTIVFDKTGTLTKGEFKITEIVPANPTINQEDLIRNLIYTEFYSNHPIGISIVDSYGRDNIFAEIIEDFEDLSGGAKALINGNRITVGNYKLMQSLKVDVPVVNSTNLVVYILKERVYIGYVLIGDVIRDDAKDTINQLRTLGVKKIYILTGDSKGIAESVACEIGVDEVYSELLPDEKVRKLIEIKENKKTKGKTAFIGDGINDAPVIATSDVGIAMGSTGSDATIAIADVVIMSDNLERLSELIKIAKKTRRKVVENIIFSLLIKTVVIVMSVIPWFTLPLWMAIFSDVGVSLIAILNSLLLLNFYNRKPQKQVVEEEAAK